MSQLSNLAKIEKKEKKVGIFIQARTNSKRLHDKVNKKIKTFSVLERCIISVLPLLEHKNIKTIYILCPLRDKEIFTDLSKKYGIKILSDVWDENKVLERFYNAIKETKVDYVIRICSDKIINHTTTQFDMLNYIMNNNNIEYVSCEKDPLRTTTGEIYKSEALINLYERLNPNFMTAELSTAQDEGMGVDILINNSSINYREIFEHISVAFKNKIKIEPTLDFFYDFSIDTQKDFNAIKKIVYYLYKNKKNLYPKDDYRNHIIRLEDIIELEDELEDLKNIRTDD